MIDRNLSPWMMSRLCDAGLRERLADARTMLMYGHTQEMREQAMTAIERISAELVRRGYAG